MVEQEIQKQTLEFKTQKQTPEKSIMMEKDDKVYVVQVEKGESRRVKELSNTPENPESQSTLATAPLTQKPGLQFIPRQE